MADSLPSIYAHYPGHIETFSLDRSTVCGIEQDIVLWRGHIDIIRNGIRTTRRTTQYMSQADAEKWLQQASTT